MNSRYPIQQELAQVAPQLSQLLPATPYAVPKGYFERLASSIQVLCSGKQTIAPSLPVQYATHRPTVPEGYFDTLAGNILQKIKASAAGLPPAADLPPSYRVPDGYFATLPEVLTARVVMPASKQGKVVRFSIGKWLAAAALIGAIAIGMYTLTSPEDRIEQNMSKISDQTIEQYLAEDPDLNAASIDASFDQEAVSSLILEDVSDEEIEQFLANQGIDAEL